MPAVSSKAVVVISVELITLIGALFTFGAAAISAFLVIWGAISKLSRDVDKVHLIINSRLDELLELTRKTAHMAGLKEGREEEK